MQAYAGDTERLSVVGPLALIGCTTAALAAAAVTGVGTSVVAPLAAVAALIAVSYGRVFEWQSLIAALLLLILFVPIRKYTLSSSLPFELEPYRLFVAAIVVVWLAALLVDPRVRLRSTGFEAQILLVIGAAIASILINAPRIVDLSLTTDVVKKLTFFLSFVFTYYVIASVVRSRSSLLVLLKVLVGGGAVVGGCALIEFNTGYDVFDHLGTLFPFLQLQDLPFQSLEVRGGQARVYASSEHPIALGAAFILLVPFSVYLARTTSSRLWWAAAALLALGSLSTISRTSILMLLVVAIVFMRVQPHEVKRLIPLLVPAIVVVHLALPGSIGTIKDAFFPQGGLIEEQRGAAGTRGSGRVADLGPGLDEWARTPLFGQGYGTRIVDQGPKQNAPILDNQWLGTLLETGIIGAVAWLWLFVRFTRRFIRRAREETGDERLLFASFASAAASYGVSMIFYDAFSFIQVTFLLFILLAFGAAMLSHPRSARPAPVLSLAGPRTLKLGRGS